MLSFFMNPFKSKRQLQIISPATNYPTLAMCASCIKKSIKFANKQTKNNKNQRVLDRGVVCVCEEKEIKLIVHFSQLQCVRHSFNSGPAFGPVRSKLGSHDPHNHAFIIKM